MTIKLVYDWTTITEITQWMNDNDMGKWLIYDTWNKTINEWQLK